MAARPRTINDSDREEWVINDAGLYGMYQESRQGMRAFIRAHRADIDQVIHAVRDAPPPERTWRDYAGS